MGGVVASHHGSFGHFQSRSVPTNRNSPEQQAVRNAVSQLVVSWDSVLTDAQRSTWNVYAANVSRTNRLGEQVHNSGLSMYVRANVARSLVIADRIDTGPSIFNLGSFTAPFLQIAGAVAQRITIGFFTDELRDPWSREAFSVLLVFVGRPQNPGIVRYRGSYRFAGFVRGDPVPPISPLIVQTPFPFSAGQRIFVRFAVSYRDGRYTSDSFSTLIAIAGSP